MTRKYEKKQEKKDYSIVTISEVHEIFGHSRSMLNDLRTSGALADCSTRSATGNKELYNTVKIYHLLKQKDIDKLMTKLDPEDEGGDPSDNLDRFRKYAADTKKFDLKIKKGEYIEKEQILLDLRLLVTHAQKSLQMLGKEVSFALTSETEQKAIEEIIDNRVTEILSQISYSNIPERGEDDD